MIPANDIDSVAPFQKVGAVAQKVAQRWPLEVRVQEMLRDREALVLAFRQHVLETQAPLTDRENEVLSFIRGHRKANGVSPSFQQIADGVGLGSKGRVHKLIRQLEAGGYIVRAPGRRQAIALVERVA